MLYSLVFAAAFLSSQEIPQGVRYKKAPDALNKKAETKLLNFFKSPPAKADYAGMSQKVLICMPGIWESIRKVAPLELRSAKMANFYVPGPGEPQKFEGRLFKTSHEQVTFWKLLRGQCQKQPVIRKAKANELKYYWALIPYDIEEPVFIADFGASQVLFDFGGSEQDPKVLAIEVIGGLK